MKKIVRSVLVAALLGFALAFLLAHPGDYNVSLPGGFELTRLNYHTIGIVDTRKHDDWIVPPRITGIVIVDSLVVGTVENDPRSGTVAAGSAGYFILDLQSRRAALGLNREEWLGDLNGRGVVGEPVLRTPLRWALWRKLTGK